MKSNKFTIVTMIILGLAALAPVDILLDQKDSSKNPVTANNQSYKKPKETKEGNTVTKNLDLDQYVSFSEWESENDGSLYSRTIAEVNLKDELNLQTLDNITIPDDNKENPGFETNFSFKIYYSNEGLGGSDVSKSSGGFWISDGPSDDDWTITTDGANKHHPSNWTSETTYDTYSYEGGTSDEWSKVANWNHPQQAYIDNNWFGWDNEWKDESDFEFYFKVNSDLELSVKLTWTKNVTTYAFIHDVTLPTVKIKGAINEYDISSDVFNLEKTYENIIGNRVIFTTDDFTMSEFSTLIKDSIVSEKGFVSSEETKLVFFESMGPEAGVIFDSYESTPEEDFQINSPDYYFEIWSSGISEAVPIDALDEGDGGGTHKNKSKRYHLKIPYVHSYNISTNLDGDGLSESGSSSSFFVEDGGAKNEFNVYANDDIELEFTTDTWLSAKGPDGYQTGQVLTFDSQSDAGLVGSNYHGEDSEIYNEWLGNTEFLIPDKKTDGGETVTLEKAKQRLDERNLYYYEDEIGTWTSIQNMDEIYPVGDGDSNNYVKNLHTLTRWKYIMAPEYQIKNDSEEDNDISTLGRVEDEEQVITLFSEASTPYSAKIPEEIKEIKLNLYFDSTPLLDREVNTEGDLFYTAEQVWSEGDPGEEVNTWTWNNASSIDEVQWKVGYEGTQDIFGNYVTGNKADGTYTWLGTGDDPLYVSEDGSVYPEYKGTWHEDGIGRTFELDEYGNPILQDAITDGSREHYDESKVAGNPDGENDDLIPQMISEGNKNFSEYKHYLTLVEEKEELFRDVFVVNLGTDESGSSYSLDEWIGSLAETEGVHWFYDGDFIFESNPFIKTITTGDILKDVDGNIIGADDDYPYAIQEIILNEGIDSSVPQTDADGNVITDADGNIIYESLEMTAWIVYTETTVDYCVDYQLTDLGYGDYLLTNDGQKLLDSMESREVLNFSKINPDTNEVEEMTSSERAKLANKEFDAHSLEVQWKIYKNSIDISKFDSVDELIQFWAFNEQVDFSGENLVYNSELNFKPGTYLESSQLKELKDGVKDFLPYVTHDGYSTILGSEWRSESQVLNPDEWTIKTGDYWYTDGNLGKNVNNINSLEFDEYNQLVSSSYVAGNIDDWYLGTPTKKAGTKIPSNYTTIKVNDDGTVSWGGALAFEITIIHNPTRNSNYYGERKIYLPIWVTDLSDWILKQLDDEIVKSIGDLIEYIAVSNSFIPPSNYEIFVDPKERTDTDHGELINTYGNTYDQWVRGGLLNSEEQWYFDYCEDREIKPLTPEETGDFKDVNGNWSGFGDNPINNEMSNGDTNPYSSKVVDESEDDINETFILKRKDYIDFLYSQNIWDTIPNETGEGYVDEIVNKTTFFTDLAYNFTQLGSYDIEFEFGINGKHANEIDPDEAVLESDEITMWVHRAKDTTQSRWNIIEPEGGIEYSFKVWVPSNLELPEVQPPLGKDKDNFFEKIPWFGYVLMIVAILSIVVPIVWWIIKRKKAKDII